MMEKVYLGLGGNIGDSQAIILQTVESLKTTSGIFNLRLSKLYQTTPVQVLDSHLFVNAVCELYTTLNLKEFIKAIQSIERSLGKTNKHKNASRIIDIDILFYGNQLLQDDQFEIPHPRWQERLFVLRPLLDLTMTINIQKEHFNINEMVKQFKNPFNETVIPIP